MSATVLTSAKDPWLGMVRRGVASATVLLARSQYASPMRERTEPLTLTLVVPVYNEADVLAAFIDAVDQVLKPVSGLMLELMFVNDGSSDQTLERLQALAAHDPRVRVIDLSRNFGKEAALTAGLDEANGDIVIPIDVDLQDPPELIPIMIERWREGADVVLAQRRLRATDTWLKRVSAQAFYALHNLIADQQLPPNVGDFRLLDRRVVDALRRLPERRRFMKGLFAWVGFRSVVVDFERAPRVAGASKFNTWRLWNFALEGITSFSTAPLKAFVYGGAAISLAAFGYMFWIIAKTLIYGIDLPGYASLMSTVLFLGGIQLVGIGVLGEYLGRVYLETKQRPTYLVRDRYGARELPLDERR